jgi:hypothetical protein
MTLIKELFDIQAEKLLEGGTKEYISDLIEEAINKVDVFGKTYEQAVHAIARKVLELDTKDMIGDDDFLMNMIKAAYTEDEHKKAVKEDTEEEDLPKILVKAGNFSVELHPNDQVQILSGNEVLTTMPIVIWRQLSRW